MSDQTSQKDDGWDWEWIFFYGTIVMGISEEQFWSMTPRRFYMLLSRWEEYQTQQRGTKQGTKGGKSQQVVDGYLDQIPGW